MVPVRHVSRVVLAVRRVHVLLDVPGIHEIQGCRLDLGVPGVLEIRDRLGYIGQERRRGRIADRNGGLKKIFYFYFLKFFKKWVEKAEKRGNSNF